MSKMSKKTDTDSWKAIFINKEPENIAPQNIEESSESAYEDETERLITESLEESLTLSEMQKHMQEDVAEDLSEEENGEVEERHLVPVIALCAVAALLIAMIVFLCVKVIQTDDTSKDTSESSASSFENTVVVPNLIGLTDDEAKELVKDHQVGFKIKESVLSKAPFKTIVAQDPKPGERVEPYSTIYVNESVGLSELQVPDIDRKTTNDAITVLKEAGVSDIEVEKVYDTGATFDTVVSTKPERNSKINLDDTIYIRIAAGKKGDTASPSDYTGLEEKAALEAARKDKLCPIVEYGHSDIVETGEVFFQSVEKNSPLASGAEIVLYVSAGEAAKNLTFTNFEKVEIELPETATGGAYTLFAREKVAGTMYEVWLETGDQAPPFPHKAEVMMPDKVESCVLHYCERNENKEYTPKAYWTVVEEKQDNAKTGQEESDISETEENSGT